MGQHPTRCTHASKGLTLIGQLNGLWPHKEMGQLHRQPQTPFTARPQKEIQSALTHTTASTEINVMGLEKGQAKQGLSHARSFFCGCPRVEFDILRLRFHHQNELPRRKADTLLSSSSLSLIISNALQVLMTQTSHDGWRQENNDDHFILGKCRLSSQIKSTVLLRKATAYLDSVL